MPLPEAAAGVRLFGAVAAEELLKTVPALCEAGTAVAVALLVARQLAESVLRVRRARRLPGGDGPGCGRCGPSSCRFVSTLDEHDERLLRELLDEGGA